MKLLEVDMEASLANVSRMRRDLREALGQARLSRPLVSDLQLAFSELAANTIKHGNPVPSRIGLRATIEGTWLKLEVTDNGGPFEQFEDSWAASLKRDLAAKDFSGLGIPLISAIFPVATYEAATPNKFVGWRPLVLRKPTLLIFEESDVALEDYADLRRSYHVLTATTVEAALSLCDLHRVDLIVCNLEVADLGGYRLLETLEADKSRAAIPIVVTTEDQSLHEAPSFGGDVEVVLTKPAPLAAVEKALAEALSHRALKLRRELRHVCAAFTSTELEAEAGGCRIELLRGADIASGRSLALKLSRDGGQRLVLIEALDFGLKGTAVALQVAATANAVHRLVKSDPGQFLTNVSKAMHAETADQLSIASIQVLDIDRDGSIALSSAGHRPALIVTADRAVRPIGHEELPAGLSANAHYAVERTNLEPGERIVLLTDTIRPLEPGCEDMAPTVVSRMLADADGLVLSALTDRARDLIHKADRPSYADDWLMICVSRAG